MSKRRGLPNIKIIRSKNSAGVHRIYVYRALPDGTCRRLPSNLEIDDPKFVEAYHAAGKAYFETPEKDEEFLSSGRRGRVKRHSVAWLINSYTRSDQWHMLRFETRRSRARLLRKIAADFGDEKLDAMTAQRLRGELARHGPTAANNLLKAWRAIYNHAVQNGVLEASPAAPVRRRPYRRKPFKPWPPEAIDQFRRFWPVGTEARLLFELVYYTGARCSDVRRMRWGMIDGEGWLCFSQQKTEGPVQIPLIAALPDWLSSFAEDQRMLLACLPPTRVGRFIRPNRSRPVSAQRISKWFSALAHRAGVPEGYTAHGLRNNRAINLAYAGATHHQIAACTGHVSLRSVDYYTMGAERRLLLSRHPSQRGAP